MTKSPEQAEKAVKVKPLEWLEHVAETPFGDYWTLQGIDGRVTLGAPNQTSAHWQKFSSEDEAKAAAEANYEQRILSALEPDDRLATAMEALRPFAEIAEWDIGDSEADEDAFKQTSPRNAVAGVLKVGHLRAALAALRTMEAKDDR